jgi:hypothetical protein
MANVKSIELPRDIESAVSFDEDLAYDYRSNICINNKVVAILGGVAGLIGGFNAIQAAYQRMPLAAFATFVLSHDIIKMSAAIYDEEDKLNIDVKTCFFIRFASYLFHKK